MPKKASRHPVRTKSRARRPAPSRPSSSAPAAPPEEEVAAPVATATAPVAATMTRPTATAPRRPVRPAAKAPTLTINYSYLRHDLSTLAILAPLMVVLVIGSYFIFH